MRICDRCDAREGIHQVDVQIHAAGSAEPLYVKPDAPTDLCESCRKGLYEAIERAVHDFIASGPDEEDR